MSYAPATKWCHDFANGIAVTRVFCVSVRAPGTGCPVSRNGLRGVSCSVEV